MSFRNSTSGGVVWPNRPAKVKAGEPESITTAGYFAWKDCFESHLLLWGLFPPVWERRLGHRQAPRSRSAPCHPAKRQGRIYCSFSPAYEKLASRRLTLATMVDGAYWSPKLVAGAHRRIIVAYCCGHLLLMFFATLLSYNWQRQC